ncbi:hypothetical protein [Anaerotignum sp.]
MWDDILECVLWIISDILDFIGIRKDKKKRQAEEDKKQRKADRERPL